MPWQRGGQNLKTNFILIDLENIQPLDCELLSGVPFKVKVFVGANQSKIPLKMVQALQAFGPNAEYIQIEGNGSNALDFHIAYYIGRLSVEFPDSFFHVVSKDTGFDPLIKHLKTRKVFCQRVVTIADIPLLKINGAKSLPERVSAVVDSLTKKRSARPRTVRTLCSTIQGLFFNQLTEPEVTEIMERLTASGFVAITDGKVTYHLP